MNARKTIFAAGGIGVILILLAFRLGWIPGLQRSETPVPSAVSQPVPKRTVKKSPVPEARPQASPPAPEKKDRTAAPQPAPADEKLLGSGDPFTYAAAGTGDYTPLSGNKNVGTITVKGIIRIDGEAPRAILHLKDSDRVHYVSKDSVVRISTGSKKGTSPAEAYIVVKDIRNDEVELIQLERPDKVIIIR